MRSDAVYVYNFNADMPANIGGVPLHVRSIVHGLTGGIRVVAGLCVPRSAKITVDGELMVDSLDQARDSLHDQCDKLNKMHKCNGKGSF